MALQTCKRCRKRRIKCDLELPSCGNCSLAGGLECLFFDEALGQEFPRSYLYALRKRVRELEAELESYEPKNEVEFNNPLQTEPSSLVSDDTGYHLNASIQEGLLTIPETLFLGSGSAAYLVQHILKEAAKTSELHSSQISSLLRSLDKSSPSSQWPTLSRNTLETVIAQQKMEPLSCVTPSTQRALFEHYFRVIQPEFPLIPPEQENRFSRHENPLRWCLANSDNHDAFAMSAVFSISAAFIARDSNPELQLVASSCKDALWKSTQQVLSNLELHRSFYRLKQIATAFIFLSILELVHPSTGQIWELVGSAKALLETVRAEHPPTVVDLDEEFHHLEFLLTKLESSIAIHFRRPSTYLNNWSLPTARDTSFTNPYVNFAHHRSARQIAQSFSLSPRPEEGYFLSLIPDKLRVESANSDISDYQAIAYLPLHPLFTSSISSDVFSQDRQSSTPPELFQIIATSASIVIESIAQDHKNRKFICIWMAAERLVEAGAVWGLYLLVTKKAKIAESDGGMGMAKAMKPLYSCSTLLTSFAERWKEGSAYVDIWEAYLSFLWTVI